MLDITLLRKDLAHVVTRLETRKSPQAFLNVEAFTALEAERKTLQMRTEELQAKRNALSKQIGQLKAKGPAGQAEVVARHIAPGYFGPACWTQGRPWRTGEGWLAGPRQAASRLWSDIEERTVARQGDH